jgi:hypothetical protein
MTLPRLEKVKFVMKSSSSRRSSGMVMERGEKSGSATGEEDRVRPRRAGADAGDRLGDVLVGGGGVVVRVETPADSPRSLMANADSATDEVLLAIEEAV